MSGNLEQYLSDLERGLDKTMVAVNKELTLRHRVKRSWSMRQCSRFLNVSYQYLTKFAASSNDFPAGTRVGRERVFTLNDLMHMRALLASNAKRPYDYLVLEKTEFAPARDFIRQSKRRNRKIIVCRSFCAISEPSLRNACRCYGCRSSEHYNALFCWRRRPSKYAE